MYVSVPRCCSARVRVCVFRELVQHCGANATNLSIMPNLMLRPQNLHHMPVMSGHSCRNCDDNYRELYRDVRLPSGFATVPLCSMFTRTPAVFMGGRNVLHVRRNMASRVTGCGSSAVTGVLHSSSSMCRSQGVNYRVPTLNKHY